MSHFQKFFARVFAILIILFPFDDLFVIAQIDNFINCIQLLRFLNWVFFAVLCPSVLPSLNCICCHSFIYNCLC